MRKDIKLGLAIGGVVLAVAVVFVLVNSSKTKPDATTDDNSVVQSDNTDTQTDMKPGDKPVADADKPAADNKAPADQPKPADQQAKTDAAKPPAGQDTGNTAQGKTDVASGGTVGNGSPAPAGDKTAPADKTQDDSQKPVASNDKTTDPHAAYGGGVADWSKMLADGQMPSMSATGTVKTVTPAPTSPIAFTAGKAAGDGVFDPAAVTNDQDDANRGLANTAVVPTRTALVEGGAATRHSIQDGETFSTIAAAYYGNARYYKLIQQANPGVDSSHLKIGQVINLPAAPAKTSVSSGTRIPAVSDKPIDATKQYRVQSGDNLHRICVRLYGDPKLVKALYELNKSQIGNDPAKLKLGMVLTLPQAPVQTASR